MRHCAFFLFYNCTLSTLSLVIDAIYFQPHNFGDFDPPHFIQISWWWESLQIFSYINVFILISKISAAHTIEAFPFRRNELQNWKDWCAHCITFTIPAWILFSLSRRKFNIVIICILSNYVVNILYLNIHSFEILIKWIL